MKLSSEKTAVVTGAAGGVGAALCAELAGHGVTIVMYDVDGAALDDAADRLRDGGRAVHTYAVDVTDATAVEEAVKATVSEVGPIDILCSNAGILRPGAVWEQPADTWEKIVAVNLLGTVNLGCAIVPRMLASGREGHIVTTVGVTAVFTSPFSPPGSYAVSKHALLAYTEILYQELQTIGAPIGVSCLSPSGVRSNIAADPDAADGDVVRRPEIWKRVEALYSSIRSGHEPADVARQTADAISENRFWIYPDPADVLRVNHRADYIAKAIAPSAPASRLS